MDTSEVRLNYPLPARGAKYCDTCVPVCLSVCLPAYISRKPHGRTSSNFLYVLPVAVARRCNMLCTSGFMDGVGKHFNLREVR